MHKKTPLILISAFIVTACFDGDGNSSDLLKEQDTSNNNGVVRTIDQKNYYLDANNAPYKYQQQKYGEDGGRYYDSDVVTQILAENGNSYYPSDSNGIDQDLYRVAAAAVPVGYGCSDREITGGGQEVYLKPAIMTISAEKLSARRNQYDPVVKMAAIKHGVDPYFVHGIISQESAYQPKIEGPKTRYGTAKGMMQLLDGTARDMGVHNTLDLFIAEINIDAGTKYLKQQLNRFDGNATLAAAAYNAGYGNIIKCGNRISPYAGGQTLDYVQKVLGYANAIYRSDGQKHTTTPSHNDQ